METKFTKGELKLDLLMYELENGTNNSSWITIKDINGNNIAETKGPHCGISNEQCLANAKLFAAAPDLLEALVDILPTLGHYKDLHVRVQKKYLAAEKAIKKATE